MSLDVYLRSKTPTKKTCSYCLSEYEEHETLYDANITHNLGKMASEVKVGEHTLYKYLWRPEEIGIKHAGELIKPLQEGLAELKAKPEVYEKYNAKNGWGLYEHFVPFVEKYLTACEEYPDAKVEVSR